MTHNVTESYQVIGASATSSTNLHRYSDRSLFRVLFLIMYFTRTLSLPQCAK